MSPVAAEAKQSHPPQLRYALASILAMPSNSTITGTGSSSGGSGSVGLGTIVIPIGWEECQANSDWNLARTYTEQRQVRSSAETAGV
jgi:hypothetical protein